MRLRTGVLSVEAIEKANIINDAPKLGHYHLYVKVGDKKYLRPKNIGYYVDCLNIDEYQKQNMLVSYHVKAQQKASTYIPPYKNTFRHPRAIAVDLSTRGARPIEIPDLIDLNDAFTQTTPQNTPQRPTQLNELINELTPSGQPSNVPVQSPIFTEEEMRALLHTPPSARITTPETLPTRSGEAGPSNLDTIENYNDPDEDNNDTPTDYEYSSDPMAGYDTPEYESPISTDEWSSEDDPAQIETYINKDLAVYQAFSKEINTKIFMNFKNAIKANSNLTTQEKEELLNIFPSTTLRSKALRAGVLKSVFENAASLKKYELVTEIYRRQMTKLLRPDTRESPSPEQRIRSLSLRV